MHATYCFLIEVEKPTLIDDVIDQYQVYVDEFCDSNNYDTPMAVVFPEGEVINLVDKPDHRNRESFASIFTKLAKNKRWNKALQFAKDCVIDEVESCIRALMQDNSFSLPKNSNLGKPIVDKILDEISKRALLEKDNYQQFIYTISRALTVIDQLNFPGNKAPFTGEVVNPYDSIRAIDLSKNCGADMVILFVDIHT